MSENNMDLFNLYAAKIFDSLYSQFPVRNDIIAAMFLDEEERDNEDHIKIFCGTVDFLARENFIIYETRFYGNTYSDVCLTSKGLSVLNAIPESINEKEPFITKIRSALKSCGNEVMKTAIQGLIKFGVSQISG